ncbi:hypothetical protein ACHAXR_011661 [Thalassiosira sp. AJA248-18]
MATHQWLVDEPASAEKAKRSSGVNPSSFYKKLRNNERLTTTEKELGNILHLAAHNEVVQKRSDHTNMKKMQLEAYHDVTSLKTFPLQDLAIEYLDAKLALPSCQSLHHEDKIHMVGDVKIKPSACGGDPQYPSLNNYNTREMRTFTTKFLAEKSYLPPKNKKAKLNDSDEQRQPFQFLPELWSFEPRIFALEYSSTGKRRYVVGNLGRFLQHYWRDNSARSRHYYELIRESTPCRLYFDLEFCKKANPHTSSDESEVLMTEFIQELELELQHHHGIQIDRSCIIDLDSSTDKKFSRHLIIHLPNGELFADACSAGVFAKRFVGRLAEELSTGVLVVRRATLAKHLFVNKQPPKTEESRSLESGKTAEHDVAQCSKSGLQNKNVTSFVDLGVYTRNRLFRLMGSVKYGKSASAVLRIANENKFRFPDGFDNSKIYLTDHNPCRATCSNSPVSNDASTTHPPSSMSRDHDAFCAALDWESHARALALTLVVPANASKVNFPVLMEPNKGGKECMKSSVSSIARRPKSSSRSSNSESHIPKLDNFILQLSKRGGINGKIRSWSIECVSRQGKPDAHYMSYQMSDNRWCENINRMHKSNNIIWNIDLTGLGYWQTCHDPDCRASNFRGYTRPLPEEVAMDISEYLLDQELAELDEDKIISRANHVPVEFSDPELDKALGDLDMSLFCK